MEDRIITPTPTPEDKSIEPRLRPHRLAEFIGQESLKENLSIFIKAAKGRGEGLDHTLFYGPPGLGKTSLAYIIGREMGVGIKAISAPILERAGDLAAILTNLGKGDVLFLDEIHRLNRTVEEVLYQAMEDFRLDIIIGKGPTARTIKIELPPFTLVGATTRAGMLTSPLRDRFGIVDRLGFYNQEEMKQIVKRSAGILDCPLEEGGADEIASRSRGTPRIANRLLRRIRDYAQVMGKGVITASIADNSLQKMGIDRLGLDGMDRRLLEVIIDKFNGGPVGIKTLEVALSESDETIEDVYEPYLVQIGFLNRTSRGRCVTPLAYKHLQKSE
ncbi:MAG: Holliday junction branch migration DNA helicase RuvB [bacterium]